MTEELLQHIWEYKLFNNNKFIASTGDEVEIISPGYKNFNAGPDFFDTRIKINNTIWVGNCELHLKSSDWFDHQHHNNEQYDNVILHVVLKNDVEIFNSKGLKIPTIALTYPSYVEKNYNLLVNNKIAQISCGQFLQNIDKIYITAQLSKITIERLMNRYYDIKKNLNLYQNDWDTSFYISLARSFGFHVNAVPFELLAQSLSLRIIMRHNNNIMQIEALLFGQAGLLNTQFNDDYPKQMQKEYQFLKNKYHLKHINSAMWKNSHIRPNNFPSIRISQFANLLNHDPQLFSKITMYQSINEIEKLFSISASQYWDNHFLFDKVSTKTYAKIFSKSSTHLIIINTIIPYIFAYGIEKNIDEFKNKAIQFLEELPPETNYITNIWEKVNIVARNAYESQALIQQFNYYCSLKKCLNCSISQQIINVK